MARQSAVSELFGKYASKVRKAINRHKDDEVELKGGGGDLPPGITGIAMLTDLKIDKFKSGDLKGQPNFYAAGSVVTPKMFQGMPIEGSRTWIVVPLCDTPGRTKENVEDHVKDMVQELKLLTKDMEIDWSELELDSDEEIQGLFEEILEAAPYFKFRTWQGQATKEFPNPRVNHTWMGAVDYVEEEDPNVSGMKERTKKKAEEAEEEEEAEDEEEEETPKRTSRKESKNGKPEKAVRGKPGRKPKKVEEEVEEEEEKEFDEFGDLDSLAEKADAKDKKAAKQLTEIALEQGFSKEDVEEKDSWEDVAEMIRSGKDEEEEEPEEEEDTEEPEEEEDEEEEVEEESSTPEKGNSYKYVTTVTNNKGKKVKKEIDVEVIRVNPKNETADLKNLDDGKTVYKGVDWTDLIPNED